jgi:rhamnosyltransferase
LDNLNKALGIVLYNPDEDFYKNLLSYLNEFQFIYINDNSNNENILIKDLSYRYKNIIYKYNNNNLGIAKSLNLICHDAIKDNNKYILILDQDSKILNFKYNKLINSHILINDKVAIISLSFSETNFNDNLYEKDIVLSSGSILNLNIWSKMNGFEEKLFIDEVDHDYCLRILNNKFLIIGTSRKYIEHKVGFIKPHKILYIKNILVSYHNPLRTYYCFRNSNYIIFKYLFTNKLFVLNRILNLCKEIYFSLFVYTEKKQHFFFMCLGLIDFIRSKYGKLN